MGSSSMVEAFPNDRAAGIGSAAFPVMTREPGNRYTKTVRPRLSTQTRPIIGTCEFGQSLTCPPASRQQARQIGARPRTRPATGQEKTGDTAWGRRFSGSRRICGEHFEPPGDGRPDHPALAGVGTISFPFDRPSSRLEPADRLIADQLPALLTTVTARRFWVQHEASLHTATGRSLP